ncbi:GGDEF domain-containing protein [Vibrio sp. ZSDE26]|uniref:diguanylate cyclase n=1 Tax=Vibrio amylolyticus TaxID=2847292 RepID=A0A9X1XIT3_9VIBR|nr:GGDEF domain-containing protein [Vibrio amylolyticus]MCK6264027.1 GGDEF domain-containing protein [Vibrio amylolyticus]
MKTFLSRSKTLLIVLSIILIIANFYLLSSTRDLTKSYTNQQNQATWFLFQLMKEFSELRSVSPYMLEGEKEFERTWLKYELTWSRFDILLYNQESHQFMALKGAQAFFELLFSRFKKVEEHLEQATDIERLSAVNRDFDLIYNEMVTFINENYRLKNPLHKKRIEQAQQLAYIQYLLMMLLFSCIALVSYIFYKESKQHKKLAYTDTLTGIPNRFSLFESLEESRKESAFTLFLLDLNGFKSVNDSFGHQAGDEALSQIAWRLTNMILIDQYKAYRMGGDEFAIILRSNLPDDIHNIISQIEACFEETIQLEGGYNVRLGCSVGTSSYPDDTMEISQLISIADHNMYKMKKTDKKGAS